MNGPHILDHLRVELADEVTSQPIVQHDSPPLEISPWAAMSLLQKAIRRGHAEWALRAASTLLSNSPERLWRRLGVIAFEDIGVGDFDAISLTVAGLKGKTLRAEIGGEWAVASYLISRMCRSAKCRAADDLTFVAEMHPAYERPRLDLTFRPVPRLLDVVCSDRSMIERSIALWHAIGTNRCPSDALRVRKGDPWPVMDALCERGYPDTIVEVCREGLRKTNCILAQFVILLWQEYQNTESHVIPDAAPPESMVGQVPGWCFDMHVREGKAAMARLIETSSHTARWLNDNLPRNKRSKTLEIALFRVESQIVDRRVRWPLGDELRRMADLEAMGIEPGRMQELLDLLRNELPLLDDLRRQVITSNLR